MFKNKGPSEQGSLINEETDAGMVGKIAPAVALLLLGATASAQADAEDDFTPVPEPGSLSLLAAGAVAAGTIKYIQRKRRK